MNEYSKLLKEVDTETLYNRLENYRESKRIEPYLDDFYTNLIFVTKRELRLRGEEI